MEEKCMSAAAMLNDFSLEVHNRRNKTEES